MATKAQWFRYRQQRSGKKRPPKPRRRRGVSVHRKSRLQSTAARNRHGDHYGRAERVLEDSKSGRPSRKSTRKGAVRAAAQKGRRVRMRVVSPQARAARRGQ